MTSASTVPALSNVPGVELARTGQWSASTGVATLTRDDLAQAVAALDCPALRDPVIKLGHTDPRFDGEPAVGRITNLAVVNSCSLVGDLTGMPGWLGPILANAYPSRSIEGEWDHRCAIGHVHPFVITGLALLGVTEPAIGSLAPLQDIADLWTTPPAGIEMKGTAMPKTIAAAATVEDIRRAYYDFAGWELWIEEIQLNPLQLIVVNDNDGSRARIPVLVDPEKEGGDAITFGEPVEVIVRYDDVAAPVTPVTGGQPLAASKLRFASRAESRSEMHAGRTGKEVSAMAETTTPASNSGGLTDDQKAALRGVLGLTEDADDATFTAALEALVQKAKADSDEDAADGGADEATEDKPAVPAQPVAAARTELGVPKTVTVDAEQWDEVQKFMAASAKRDEAAQVKAADELVDSAFRAGKIGRNTVPAYKDLARADFARAKTVLDSIEASAAFPVGEIGHSVDVGDSTTDVRQDAKYQNWGF